MIVAKEIFTNGSVYAEFILCKLVTNNVCTVAMKKLMMYTNLILETDALQDVMHLRAKMYISLPYNETKELCFVLEVSPYFGGSV